MEEQKLRQLFKNRSNCYIDTDDVVQGMDEDCFVETVNEILHLYDIVGRSEECAHTSTYIRTLRCNCCNDCGEILDVLD